MVIIANVSPQQEASRDYCIASESVSVNSNRDEGNDAQIATLADLLKSSREPGSGQPNGDRNRQLDNQPIIRIARQPAMQTDS
ncbi:hypothetical protein E2C01_080493 [Portunus trituberculatus]|uniref:Uncharacterized protein n=1 Tax=Portunus trituberculatus TaxID=210409 RepID=A0A5B7IYJ2_PORTR|nr:hypothetical protein [Portunus trituberculatus]